MIQFRGVDDDSLLLSLYQIREAAKLIWKIDAPRAIHNFPDHGVEHSERLAAISNRLLESNESLPLDELEKYLLLAGIYLHDIGMQCDVVNYPDILKIAEQLGAKFYHHFSSKTTNDFSIEEQLEIRKNHSFLTAAWISYAKLYNETVLAEAVKTIPEDIIDDLMDICMFHSNLPITKCPIFFKFDPTKRKQLLAALLRFSDELDIDSSKADIRIIKNFRLPAENAVYWWMHNRTRVIISDHNVIYLLF